MDIVPQILLNVSVLVLGLTCLYPVSYKVNPPLHVAIAWFTGWAVVVISEILLVVLGYYVTLPKIVFVSVLFPVAIWIFAKKTIDKELFCELFKATERCRALVYMLIFSILAISLLVYFGNYIWFSGDSFMFRLLSQVFHKSGAYITNNNPYFSLLYDSRLPFYVSIHSIAYLSGIKLFYSFMSVTTLFSAMGLYGFLRAMGSKTFFSTLCFALIPILFLSNRITITHSFYYHSNLTTMGYYALGILSLDRYLEDKDNFWFIIACLFLGSTGILRKEMLLISVLPFLFLRWNNYFPRLRIVLFGYALYFLFGYLWFSYGIAEQGNISKIIKSGFLLKSAHGGQLIVLSCFGLSLATFFIPWHVIKKKIRIAIYFIILICIIVFGLHFNARVAVAAHELFLLMFKNVGHWESFWYLLFIGMFGYYLFAGISKFFAEFKIGNLLGFNFTDNDRNSLNFLTFVILSFFLVRLALYSTFNFEARTWNYAGNRMLLHIFPVAIYFFGRVCHVCSQKSVNGYNIGTLLNEWGIVIKKRIKLIAYVSVLFILMFFIVKVSLHGHSGAKFKSSSLKWKGSGITGLWNLPAPLTIQSYSGDFRFTRITTKAGDIIRVLPVAKKGKDGKILIRFGYKVDSNLKPGDNIIATVSARCSDGGGKILFYIQDRKRIDTTIDSTSIWGKYMISKKIRPGETTVHVSILWEPGNENQWLDLKDFRVYDSLVWYRIDKFFFN